VLVVAEDGVAVKREDLGETRVVGALSFKEMTGCLRSSVHAVGLVLMEGGPCWMEIVLWLPIAGVHWE